MASDRVVVAVLHFRGDAPLPWSGALDVVDLSIADGLVTFVGYLDDDPERPHTVSVSSISRIEWLIRPERWNGVMRPSPGAMPATEADLRAGYLYTGNDPEDRYRIARLTKAGVPRPRSDEGISEWTARARAHLAGKDLV